MVGHLVKINNCRITHSSGTRRLWPFRSNDLLSVSCDFREKPIAMTCSNGRAHWRIPPKWSSKTAPPQKLSGRLDPEGSNLHRLGGLVQIGLTGGH